MSPRCSTRALTTTRMKRRTFSIWEMTTNKLTTKSLCWWDSALTIRRCCTHMKTKGTEDYCTLADCAGTQNQLSTNPWFTDSIWGKKLETFFTQFQVLSATIRRWRGRRTPIAPTVETTKLSFSWVIPRKAIAWHWFLCAAIAITSGWIRIWMHYLLMIDDSGFMEWN